MLTLAHLDARAYVARPWKNGLGTTRDILVDPLSPYRFRISSADVPASGPFSAFDGYERTLVLLSGGPITLTHDGVRCAPLAPLDIARFSGDAVTTALVDAPARDLNVFTRRGDAEARVAVHRLQRGTAASLAVVADEHLLYAVAGEGLVSLEGEAIPPRAFSTGDSVRASGSVPDGARLCVHALTDTVCIFVAIDLA